MSAHASVQPHQLSGTFFPSVTVEHDNPDDRNDAWIFFTALAPRKACQLSGERPGPFSEWRFGDLTLTREVRRAGQPAPSPRQPQRARRQGCVILLRADHERAPSTLIVSPRANLAMPVLAWPAQHSGQDCEVLTLFLPFDAFVEPDAVLQAWCIDTAAGTGALLAHFMRQLAGHLAQIPDDRAGPLATATRALVVACIAPTNAQVTAVATTVISSIVERARLMVQRHMASPDFGPQQLARLLAMSRSKLYRLLDGDGGVAHFINRERLMRAWRDLTVPGDAASVHAIANEVGFRDHSTFSRAFRREFGCSPTEARERALVARPDPAITTPDAMQPPHRPRGPAGARPCGRMG